MKALTVCQPHTWAIIHGDKRIENRSWYSGYRGPLIIHAGKSRKWLDDYEQYPNEPPHSELVFGALIGIVLMYDCLALSKVAECDYAEGPWCHMFSETIPFTRPVPYRGQQGYFDVPLDVFEHALPDPAEKPSSIWNWLGGEWLRHQAKGAAV